MWSFVGNKTQPSWIGFDLDVANRIMVGDVVGQRDRNGALRLWQSLPSVND